MPLVSPGLFPHPAVPDPGLEVPVEPGGVVVVVGTPTVGEAVGTPPPLQLPGMHWELHQRLSETVIDWES